MTSKRRVSKALWVAILSVLVALPASAQMNPVTGLVELPREQSRARRLAGLPVIPGHRIGFQNSEYGVGGIAPYAVAVGDFNHDGKPDLAVANNCGSGNDGCGGGGVPGSVSILLGNGDGTFQPQVSYQTGEYSENVVVADFNGDHNLDLGVANGQDGTISILLGNGDGTFQPQVAYKVGLWVAPIAIGDFDGDGKLDLAVSNLQDGTVGILLGNGDGTFQNQVEILLGLSATGIAAGDFNHDGKVDLAVAVLGSDYLGSVAILLGRRWHVPRAGGISGTIRN